VLVARSRPYTPAAHAFTWTNTQELTGEFKVETQLSDHFVCGATLAAGQGGSNPPVKNVFARITETVMGRNVKANLKVRCCSGAQ